MIILTGSPNCSVSPFVKTEVFSHPSEASLARLGSTTASTCGLSLVLPCLGVTVSSWRYVNAQASGCCCPAPACQLVYAGARSVQRLLLDLHVHECPLRGGGAFPGSSNGIHAGASSPSSPKPLRVQRSFARLVLFSPPNMRTRLSTLHMQCPYRGFGRMPFTFSSVHTDLHSKYTMRSFANVYCAQVMVLSMRSFVMLTS